jgi:hypothetical protein
MCFIGRALLGRVIEFVGILDKRVSFQSFDT